MRWLRLMRPQPSQANHRGDRCLRKYVPGKVENIRGKALVRCSRQTDESNRRPNMPSRLPNKDERHDAQRAN